VFRGKESISTVFNDAKAYAEFYKEADSYGTHLSAELIVKFLEKESF